MANAKDLRKRIISVKNTQQITRAMKMVSAAKLRRAQDAIVNLRPYARQMSSIVNNLAQNTEGENSHVLLGAGKGAEADKILIVVVSSDRGLCGGFNTNVIKTAQRYMRTNAHKYKKFELAFVGKKAYEFFKGRGANTGRYYQNFFLGINFAKSTGLSQELIDSFLKGEYDEIKFIYNEFHSAISQKIVVENFLPLRVDTNTSDVEQSMTIFEPGQKEILEQMMPRHFAVQVHRIMLESLASEHGARMAAMENATKNAGEMIHKLNLLYNKSRQAGITKELLEIVSGSEAQKA